MDKYTFILDDLPDQADESAFAGSNLVNNTFSKAIERQAIDENIKNVLRSLTKVFEDIENDKYFIDEIEVTLNVGAQGEVSILSTVSGSVNLNSGIKVLIKRKNGHSSEND